MQQLSVDLLVCSNNALQIRVFSSATSERRTRELGTWNCPLNEALDEAVCGHLIELAQVSPPLKSLLFAAITQSVAPTSPRHVHRSFNIVDLTVADLRKEPSALCSRRRRVQNVRIEAVGDSDDSLLLLGQDAIRFSRASTHLVAGEVYGSSSSSSSAAASAGSRRDCRNNNSDEDDIDEKLDTETLSSFQRIIDETALRQQLDAANNPFPADTNKQRRVFHTSTHFAFPNNQQQGSSAIAASAVVVNRDPGPFTTFRFGAPQPQNDRQPPRSGKVLELPRDSFDAKYLESFLARHMEQTKHQYIAPETN